VEAAEPNLKNFPDRELRRTLCNLVARAVCAPSVHTDGKQSSLALIPRFQSQRDSVLHTRPQTNQDACR
jgi:hypothetical protein